MGGAAEMVQNRMELNDLTNSNSNDVKDTLHQLFRDVSQ